MRALFLYCAIGSLAFAGGAPTEEESKVYTKNYTFGEKDSIFSENQFFKDELVHGICERSGADYKKCKVFAYSNKLDESSIPSCDLELRYSGRPDLDVELFGLGNSRAVFANQDGATKIKLINVNLKDCRIKEASIDVSERLTNDENSTIQTIHVVAHENNYDVIYENQQLCQENFCKATFDYEGNEIKAAASFPLKISDFDYCKIEPINNGYLVTGPAYPTTNVFLIHDKDEKPYTLYSISGFKQNDTIGSSAAENELGFCWYGDRKLLCKQYDADGKIKKIDVEITTDKERLDIIDMYNLEKGILVVLVSDDNVSREVNTFIAYFDEHGKQQKYVNTDLKCDYNIGFITNLYKNADGQYCITSTCFVALGSPDKSADFSRHTRCFLKKELF